MLVLHSKQLQEKRIDIRPFQSLCLPLVSLLVLHPGWQESETPPQAVWGQRQGHSSGKSAARQSETLNHSQSLLSTVYSDQRLFLYVESTRPPLTRDSDVPRSNAAVGPLLHFPLSCCFYRKWSNYQPKNQGSPGWASCHFPCRGDEIWLLSMILRAMLGGPYCSWLVEL